MEDDCRLWIELKDLEADKGKCVKSYFGRNV